MDGQRLGNFLSAQDLAFNLKKKRRDFNLLCLQILLVFLLGGIVAEFGMWQYQATTYSVPQAASVEDRYQRAQEINKKVKQAGRRLAKVKEDNLKIISFFTLLSRTKPPSLALNSISLEAKMIKLEGESTNLEDLKSFSQSLKLENYGPSRIETVTKREQSTSFVIVLEKKVGGKKPESTKAPVLKGAKNV